MSVFAESLGGVNNLNIYNSNGQLLATDGSDEYLSAIANKCESYDNFVSVNKEVNHEMTLDNFSDYKEL